MLRWLVALGSVTAGVVLSSCTLGLKDDDPEVPTCVSSSDGCRYGALSCQGDTVMECTKDGSVDGCYNYWSELQDCSRGGGTCDAGQCHFSETCPVGTSTFCRDNAVLYCVNGQVVNFQDCGDYICDEAPTFPGYSVFKDATCVGNDDGCSHRTGPSVECRDGELLTCSDGCITSRTSCGASPCSLELDATGAVTPLCGAAGASL